MTAPASTRAGTTPGRTTALLRLRGVTKSYGGRRVLEQVDLEVSAGETVAVLGPNGSGKSTLLRIAANLTYPDQGSVAVLGQDLPHDAPASRGNLAYVGQDPALYDDLTPAEHLRFWSRLRRKPLDAAAGDAALAKAGLAAAAHKPTVTLSRGQRQRLALTLAGLGDPPLVLFDEPFTALDAHGQRDLEETLRGRREAGAAILLSLHDLEQARRIATRVLRLDHHRLVEVSA